MKKLEIERLHRMLEEETIFNVYSLEKNPITDDIYRSIQVFRKNSHDFISVIQHKHSYGNEDNKVELMINDDSDVEGWLTAEEALKRIKEELYENNIRSN